MNEPEAMNKLLIDAVHYQKQIVRRLTIGLIAVIVIAVIALFI